MIKLIAGAVIALTTVAPAAATSYVTGTATFTGLGDSIGSQFDIVTLNSVAGSATGSGTYLVNSVDFTVGINANVAGGPFTGVFTNTATVGGSPFAYTVPYSILIGSTDTIAIGGNTFYTNGVKVHFNTLTFSNVGVGTVTGDLTATVSVPEPATWAMMVVGFGLVGVGVRRRSRTTVAA